jgi:predicted dehydrogenase
MDMVRIGVIGYGYWGPNLVRNFFETPDTRVTTVCDLRAERLAQVRMRYPTVQTTATAAELIHSAEVDAVVVATPVSSHYDLARQALEADKHVLVEKPLAARSEQARSLIDEAARRRRVLMVDHTFVYTGAVRKIKQLVDAGEVGEIYYYDSARVNLGLFQHDVSVVWDLAVHDLSIMDYVIAAKPQAVSATGISHIPGKPANIAYLTLLFEGNLIAHVNVNWLAPVKIRRTLIGGSKKMIVYDDLEPSEKIKVYDKGVVVNNAAENMYQMLVGYRAGDMWAPQISLTEALKVEAEHFVDCVQKGTTPITGGEVGYRVTRILEAATLSMAERGRLVEL